MHLQQKTTCSQPLFWKHNQILIILQESYLIPIIRKAGQVQEGDELNLEIFFKRLKRIRMNLILT